MRLDPIKFDALEDYVNFHGDSHKSGTQEMASLTVPSLLLFNFLDKWVKVYR